VDDTDTVPPLEDLFAVLFAELAAPRVEAVDAVAGRFDGGLALRRTLDGRLGRRCLWLILGKARLGKREREGREQDEKMAKRHSFQPDACAAVLFLGKPRL